MQEISFDLISDLNLRPNDSFNWENKATSLYCLLTGNVSSNPRTIVQTIAHLSKIYQGVFYVPGSLEYASSVDPESQIIFLEEILAPIPNVVVLNQHVVIIDGIAIMAANGWDDSVVLPPEVEKFKNSFRNEDLVYLNESIKKIQKHLDVKKVILLSSSVPNPYLWFGEKDATDEIPLCATLSNDTENKVTHWVFGGHTKVVDIMLDNVNYINNPRVSNSPYWPKRITITV